MAKFLIQYTVYQLREITWNKLYNKYVLYKNKLKFIKELFVFLVKENEDENDQFKMNN